MVGGVWRRGGWSDVGGGGPLVHRVSPASSISKTRSFLPGPFAGEFFKTNLNLPPGCKRWIISFMGRAHRPSAIRHRPVTRVSLTVRRRYHNRACCAYRANDCILACVVTSRRFCLSSRTSSPLLACTLVVYGRDSWILRIVSRSMRPVPGIKSAGGHQEREEERERTDRMRGRRKGRRGRERKERG